MPKLNPGAPPVRVVVPLWQALILAVICLGVGYWIGRTSSPTVSVEEPQMPAAQPEDEGLTPQDRAMIRERIDTADHYEDLVEIGHQMFDAGEPDLGIAAYEKALSIDNSDPDVWTDLGALYSDGKGRHAKALECFRKALELDPDHAKAHFNTGIVSLRHAGDVEAAKREFSAYLRLDPEGDEAARARQFVDAPADGLRQMAQSDRGHGRLAEAERELRAAMKIDPTDPEDWYWLGVVLIHQEKLKEGLDAWSEYERLAPDGAKMPTVKQMRPNIERTLSEGGD